MRAAAKLLYGGCIGWSVVEIGSSGPILAILQLSNARYTGTCQHLRFFSFFLGTAVSPMANPLNPFDPDIRQSGPMDTYSPEGYASRGFQQTCVGDARLRTSEFRPGFCCPSVADVSENFGAPGKRHSWDTERICIITIDGKSLASPTC